jgi:hypothetical protein
MGFGTTTEDIRFKIEVKGSGMELPFFLKAIKVDRSLMVVRERKVGNRPDVGLFGSSRIGGARTRIFPNASLQSDESGNVR